MELTLSRETLCFERLALLQREQVSVEGEATLPGSMRDAVTVLSVQAQAYLEKAEAVAGGVMLKGHVSFQALYTQGDLTRIRAMETTCDFEHSIEAQEATPDMRVNASVAVQETEGTAVSGRMTLRALLDIQAEAFETTRQELVTFYWRYANLAGCDMTISQGASLAEYRDGDSVKPYAKEAMLWAVDTGLIRGVDANTLAPNGTASRAMAATMLYRMVV